MKTFLLAFLLMSSVSPAWGEVVTPNPDDLSRRDLFQAEQWIALSRNLWEVGDYQTLRYYCRLIIDFYPETIYAEEAQKYMKKTEIPKKNRVREYLRHNPGMFPGL